MVVDTRTQTYRASSNNEKATPLDQQEKGPTESQPSDNTTTVRNPYSSQDSRDNTAASTEINNSGKLELAKGNQSSGTPPQPASQPNFFSSASAIARNREAIEECIEYIREHVHVNMKPNVRNLCANVITKYPAAADNVNVFSTKIKRTKLASSVNLGTLEAKFVITKETSCTT